MGIIDILILLLFVAIFVSTIILISFLQLRKKKYLLNKLSENTFDKLKVRFNQSSSGIASAVIGLPIKAEMYISENLFLITPKERGYFNGFNNLNLPVVFVKDANQSNGIENAVVPDKVKVSKWNSIVIQYHKGLIGNVRYSIQINLIDKSDIEKLNKLRAWS